MRPHEAAAADLVSEIRGEGCWAQLHHGRYWMRVRIAERAPDNPRRAPLEIAIDRYGNTRSWRYSSEIPVADSRRWSMRAGRLFARARGGGR